MSTNTSDDAPKSQCFYCGEWIPDDEVDGHRDCGRLCRICSRFADKGGEVELAGKKDACANCGIALEPDITKLAARLADIADTIESPNTAVAKFAEAMREIAEGPVNDSRRRFGRLVLDTDGIELSFSVEGDEGYIPLTRDEVRQLRDALSEWLDAASECPSCHYSNPDSTINGGSCKYCNAPLRVER